MFAAKPLKYSSRIYSISAEVEKANEKMIWINVLSLFDGLSCGQIALKELGIPVRKYYASEIDKHAIKQTQLNFPDTIQLGRCYKSSGKRFRSN